MQYVFVNIVMSISVVGYIICKKVLASISALSCDTSKSEDAEFNSGVSPASLNLFSRFFFSVVALSCKIINIQYLWKHSPLLEKIKKRNKRILSLFAPKDGIFNA